MKLARRIAVPVLLLGLLVGCASTGEGDPVVVRAEDALSNSLTFYTAAMNYHFQHSKTESPDVYRAFEEFRIKFPSAWRALDSAKRSYQRDKSFGALPVDAALNELGALISAITPLVLSTVGGKVPLMGGR